MPDPAALPGIAEASRAIDAGTLSPVALAEATIEATERWQGTIHAFIHPTAERARAAAAEAEREIRAGRRRGPLHGVPYGLKDLYDVAGLPTTAHSKLLLDNVAGADAATTARLEAAGMVLVGKLATHEFAFGGPAFDLPFPPARNPWNPAHFTGGSSSGSGAAVAAGVLPMAMGSDTGGSIRLPAAYCGTVGLKPTYGLVSRRGVVPLAYSLDHCGPLTRTVEDCALTLQALAGHDPLDPASATAAVPDYAAGLNGGIKGMRIGFARAFHAEAGVGPELLAALDAAAAALRALGAEVEDVVLPARRRFDVCNWTILHAEAFAIHAHDLRTRPGDYARITRERLSMGAFIGGGELVQAQRLRRVLTREVDAVLGRCDAILVSPVSDPAPVLEEVDDSPFRQQHPLTGGFNSTGHPGLCVPCGFSAAGLPLSLQLVGRAFDEATLLRIGHAYQTHTEWQHRRPPMPG